MSEEPSILKEFRVTLETVTPLFLGGAESRPRTGAEGMPELRPPSFRGAMRYWLRTLLGGIYGDQDKETVQKIENRVFGSAASNNDSHGSKISIRITPKDLKVPQKYEKIKGPNGKALMPPDGRDYLYWSMDQSGKAEKGNLLLARYYIPPGSSFDLSIAFKSLTNDEDIIQKYAIYSFWLATQLGGIGARSRRTAGSLFIRSDEMNQLPESLRIGTKAEIAKQLGREISAIRKNLSTGLKPPLVNSPSRFDLLHPDVCKIWILGVSKTSDLIVKTIGEQMQTYRSHTPSGQSKDTWLLERSIFGIPVKGLKGLERRSSPLWLKIAKVDGYYVGIATLFKSQLLPKGEKISYVDAAGKKRYEAPHADYGIIEKWIHGSFADSAEVSYD